MIFAFMGIVQDIEEIRDNYGRVFVRVATFSLITKEQIPLYLDPKTIDMNSVQNKKYVVAWFNLLQWHDKSANQSVAVLRIYQENAINFYSENPLINLIGMDDD